MPTNTRWIVSPWNCLCAEAANWALGAPKAGVNASIAGEADSFISLQRKRGETAASASRHFAVRSTAARFAFSADAIGGASAKAWAGDVQLAGGPRMR